MKPVVDMHRHPRFNVDLLEALESSGTHITLSSQHSKAERRVLQKTLQALGCEVTRKMVLA